MRATILMILCLLPFYANSEEKVLNDLSELEWQNRVLLIWADDSIDSPLQSHLLSLKKEIDDRHIIWFLLSKNSVISNYKGKISDSFVININSDYQENGLEMLLIGKDGGIKNRYAALDLLAVFDAIDAMPMRQYEMHNR